MKSNRNVLANYLQFGLILSTKFNQTSFLWTFTNIVSEENYTTFYGLQSVRILR